MTTELDAAFGRLAVERGAASADALSAVYANLPPGRSLAEEAVARQLITPEDARRLLWELKAPFETLAPTVDGPLAAPNPRAPAPPTSDELGLPGVGVTLGGRYQVRSILGKGGMGAVYAAWDARRGEEVAVKVLLPQVGSGAELALARFEREALAAAKVDQHAGIVRVRDYGRSGQRTYVVLDLVRGRDLEVILREDGPPPIDRALALTEAVARAIQHCHEQGIVHRDLKPANILIRATDGAPFLTDFGVALDQEAERLSKTGDLVGTPAYMSPEQADGDKAAVGARSDVYGLGAILYALVAGQPPFSGSRMEVLNKVFTARPAPLATHRADAPRDVDLVCQKALSKSPRARYPTAAALADELARLRRGDPIEARARSRVELFAWRLSRRSPRALFTVLAPALVLLFAAALAVGYQAYQWRVGSSPTACLAELLEHLERVVASDDPLGLDEGGASKLTKLITDLDVALSDITQPALAHEAPSPEAATETAAPLYPERISALADRVERLGGGAPGDAADAALSALTRDPRRRALLRALVRRAALRSGLGYRGGLPAFDVPSEGASSEDMLMNALRLLRWREQAGPVDWEPATDRARALLSEASHGAPEDVAEAARDVLRELDVALEFTLRQDAVFRRCAETAERSTAQARRELDPFGREVTAQLETKLGALLEALLLRAKRTQLAPLLEERVLFVNDDGLDWTSGSGYERLGRLLDIFDRMQRTPPAVELGAVDRLAVEAVVRISEQAQRHQRGESLDAWVRLFEAVPRRMWGEGEVPAVVYDTAFYALEQTLNRPTSPPLALFLILPRLRITPGSSYLKRQIKEFLKARTIEIYLTEPASRGEVRRKGDAYFVWAVALQSTLDQGQQTRVGNARKLCELFAKALGDDLSSKERQRLGLDRETSYVELEWPLTAFWRGYARWRLAHHLVTLLDSLPKEEQTVAAWEALLDEHRRLLRTREAFTAERGYMGVDRWIVVAYELRHVLDLYREARERRGDLSDADRRALSEESSAALEEVLPWAWKLVELTADGSDAAMQELGVKRNSLVGTMGLFDVKHNVDRLLIRGVRERSYDLRRARRHEEALALFSSTEARLWRSHLRPPLDFYLDWARALVDAGEVAKAEAKVRDVIEETQRGLRTPDRLRFVSDFDEAHRMLASMRLQAGDRDGARASLAAARAEGLALHVEWRPLIEALEGER